MTTAVLFKINRLNKNIIQRYIAHKTLTNVVIL